MPDWLRRLVLRLFRVPAEPEPPAGDPSSLRVFRAAPQYFRYRLVLWAIGQIGTLLGLAAGLVFGLAFLDRWLDSGPIGLVIGLLGVLAWLAFLAQIPIGFAALRLDYELRWYMLSDRALRIREGIVIVREQTMTFANIQQISVRQGPLQRILGIADVEVRSAGGGSTEELADDMHRGFFRGVADAQSVRDTIRARVRAYRDAGLGDGASPTAPGASAPRSHALAGRPPSAAHAGPATLSAAREVLDEARALRKALRA